MLPHCAIKGVGVVAKRFMVRVAAALLTLVGGYAYLCIVISRLGRNDHVPYRNFSLTKILRSSLGGNALTCIICTATPTLSQFEMTLSTLRFGGKAQTITNQVAANVRLDQNAELVAAYPKNIEELSRELELATLGEELRLKKQRQSNGT
jgi:hypothetical protein